jgi:hypothetical protein
MPATGTRVDKPAGVGKAAVERQLAVAEPTVYQQRVVSGGFVVGRGDRHPGPVVLAASLGALAGAAPVPGPRRQGGRDLVDALRLDRRVGFDTVAAGHRQHIPEAVSLQVPAQTAVTAVELLRARLPGRNPGIQGSGQHPPG